MYIYSNPYREFFLQQILGGGGNWVTLGGKLRSLGRSFPVPPPPPPLDETLYLNGIVHSVQVATSYDSDCN